MGLDASVPPPLPSRRVPCPRRDGGRALRITAREMVTRHPRPRHPRSNGGRPREAEPDLAARGSREADLGRGCDRHWRPVRRRRSDHRHRRRAWVPGRAIRQGLAVRAKDPVGEWRCRRDGRHIWDAAGRRGARDRAVALRVFDSRLGPPRCVVEPGGWGPCRDLRDRAALFGAAPQLLRDRAVTGVPRAGDRVWAPRSRRLQGSICDRKRLSSSADRPVLAPDPRGARLRADRARGSARPGGRLRRDQRRPRRPDCARGARAAPRREAGGVVDRPGFGDLRWHAGPDPVGERRVRGALRGRGERGRARLASLAWRGSAGRDGRDLRRRDACHVHCHRVRV